LVVHILANVGKESELEIAKNLVAVCSRPNKSPNFSQEQTVGMVGFGH
jgi:hypothetical protein